MVAGGGKRLEEDRLAIVESSVLTRSASPNIAQNLKKFTTVSKEREFTLFGKQSPFGNGSPPSSAQWQCDVTDQDAGQCTKKRGVMHALPGGSRPSTSMSLRDRAYLKSSLGTLNQEQSSKQNMRPHLPKVMENTHIPPLNLQSAVNLMGTPKFSKDMWGKMKVMGLPPRPASVMGSENNSLAENAGLHDATQHYIHRNMSGSCTASQRSTSRLGSALEPLRLNTADLIRQNEILRQENEELRRLMEEDEEMLQENGKLQNFFSRKSGQNTSETRDGRKAASHRLGTLTALSTRSAVSTASGMPRTAASSMLTGRSNLSSAGSIKFIQGEEGPAEKRIRELQAEIAKHEKVEEELRAGLLRAANSQPSYLRAAMSKPSSQQGIKPPGNSLPFAAQQLVPVPSTARSAEDAMQRIASVSRTSGNPTPLSGPRIVEESSREATASSTAAVRGAQSGQAHTPQTVPRDWTDCSSTLNRDSLVPAYWRASDAAAGPCLAESHTSSVGSWNAPVTRAGPHAVTVHSGESEARGVAEGFRSEWVAAGLKVDPVGSSFGVSNSARLTYPNKRVQTIAYAGGGSYAYAASGRPPIMVSNALPLPDGLLVRSPDASLRSEGDGGVGHFSGSSGQQDTTGELKKTVVKLGDREGNSWHASQAGATIASFGRFTRTPNLTIPVPGKAVQQDGRLRNPNDYGYDAPDRLQKWNNSGAGASMTMLGWKSKALPTAAKSQPALETPAE